MGIRWRAPDKNEQTRNKSAESARLIELAIYPARQIGLKERVRTSAHIHREAFVVFSGLREQRE